MFDKLTHINKMKPAVDKLLNHLNSKGIEFFPIDENPKLENVILKNKDKEVKISHHSFYRYSGISCVYKERTEDNNKKFEIIEVTDDMYMQNFMKPIIYTLFDIK